MDHQVEDTKYLALWREAEQATPSVVNDPREFPEMGARGIIETEGDHAERAA